jgi:flagellar biosynthetic protein FliO
MEFLGQMASVGAVLLLLVAVLWWLRRRNFALPAGRPRGRRLECLERLRLGPQHTLHLVRLGDTALLLASTPAGCTLVRSIAQGEIDGGGEADR